MAERQQYIYQDQEYDLPAGLTNKQALEIIKKHLSENAEDVEPSGATGFEETDRDVRRATNEETTIDTVSNIVSGIFDTDNFLKTQAEVAQVNKEAQEDVGKISSTVAYETAAAVPQIAFNLATMVAPETIEAIKQEVSDFGPTASVQKFIERIDPKQYLNQDEKLAAELATYLTFGGIGAKLGKKATDLLVKKFGKKKTDEIINKGVLPRIGRNIKEQAPYSLGVYAGITHAGVQLKPDENTFAQIINHSPQLRKQLEQIKKNPELQKNVGTMENFVLELSAYIDENAPQGIKDFAKSLELVEDDSERTRLIKRYTEEAAVTTLFGLPIDVVILALRTGGQSLKNIVLKLAASEAPSTSPNATLISSEAVDTASGEVVLQNTFARVTKGLMSSFIDGVGKVNTALARRFFSEAGLPKQFAKLAEDNANYIRGAEAEINSLVKELKKAQKDFNVSDDQFKNWMSGSSTKLPEDFITIADGARKQIQRNNDKINDALNLTGDKRINVVIDGERVYYRRMFAADKNMKYYSEIKEGIKRISDARAAGKDMPDDEIAIKISNARDYFRNLGVAEEDLDITVRTAVQRLAQGKAGDNATLSEVIFGDVGKSYSKSAQVLKGRKLDVEEDAPLLALLGEETAPLKRIEGTLLAQEKLIGELNFIREVGKVAEETAGNVIPMQKLVPFLPGAKTRLIKGDKINGTAIKTTDYDLLENFVKPRIGSFGGNETTLLKDIWTTPQFGKYLDFGLDLAGPRNNPNLAMSIFRRTAATVQLKETALDVPAHALAATGAGSNLGFNGTLLNWSAFREAQKAFQTMVSGLATNNKAAVNKLAFYKREGLLDQQITQRVLLDNALLERGNPNTWFKKIIKGAGQVYGTADMIGKILSYEVKLGQLKKVYPYNPKKTNMSLQEHNKFLEQKALMFAKNTMPSYGIAMPIAKSVSRTPFFGNYVMFTGETARTYKNIVKESLKELAVASKRAALGEKGAEQHVVMATKQLAGATSMVAGGYAGIDYLNDGGSILGYRIAEPSYDMKVVTKEGKEKTVQAKINVPANFKLISITAPDWGKGSKPLFSKPFMLDETAGERLTKEQKKYYEPFGGFVPQIQGEVVNSNTIIYTDYINAAAKLIIGKALGGSDEIDSTVLDKAFESAGQLITGTFTSPKFLFQGMLNVYMGVDANGKPLYDKQPGETLQEKLKAGVDALYKNTVEGGTIKAIKNLIDSSNAEELMGAGNAQRMSGFPMTYDSVLNSLSGQRFLPVRPLTAAGYVISQDLKEIAKSQNVYNEFLRKGLGGAPRKRTDEDVQKVINTFKKLQERKLEVTNSMARKMNTFKDVRYIRRYRDPKSKKIKEEIKTLGIDGVLSASTQQFKYPVKDQIVTAAVTNAKSGIKQGMFIPDKPSTIFVNFGREALARQGFSSSQIEEILDKQMKIYADYMENRKIFEKDQEKQQ